MMMMMMMMMMIIIIIIIIIIIGHIAGMEEGRNAFKMLTGKPTGKT